LKSEISRKKSFEKLLGDVVYGEIGVVTEGEIFRVISLQKKTIIEANIFKLKEAWQKPLRF
jgi:phosphoribosylformylglycinamidine synthase